jgi:hypothetical protein
VRRSKVSFFSSRRGPRACGHQIRHSVVWSLLPKALILSKLVGQYGSCPPCTSSSAADPQTQSLFAVGSSTLDSSPESSAARALFPLKLSHKLSAFAWFARSKLRVRKLAPESLQDLPSSCLLVWIDPSCRDLDLVMGSKHSCRRKMKVWFGPSPHGMILYLTLLVQTAERMKVARAVDPRA